MSTVQIHGAPSAFWRFLFLLWAGFVAFAVPEIIAGSSGGWIFSPLTLLLTIPLYGTHFLLLGYLAIRFKRTSWPGLYVLGIVFGLYETWITKVIWSGYPGTSEFAMGSYGGALGRWFGIHETLGLMLFYHATMSFLVPLILLSALFPGFGHYFPSVSSVLGPSRPVRFLRGGLAVLVGIVSGFNMPQPSLYLVSWVPALVIGGAGYLLFARIGMGDPERQETGELASAVPGRRTLAVLLILVVLIYGVTYHGLLPQKLPPATVQLVTLMLYPVLGVLLWLMPQRSAIREMSRQDAAGQTAERRVAVNWLLGVFFIGLVTSILLASGVAAGPTMVVVQLAFAAMPAIGVGLFLWLPVWRGLIRRQRND